MADEATIKDNLTRIVNESEHSLPVETLAEARSLMEHREYGVAFELVCVQLYEFDSVIQKNLYELIELLGKQMGLPETSWCFLRGSIAESGS